MSLLLNSDEAQAGSRASGFSERWLCGELGALALDTGSMCRLEKQMVTPFSQQLGVQ